MSIPNHVAIILDGNGRWATERKLPRALGHKAGAENVEWYATNDSVASVTKDGGQVTYNAVGTATIIAKTADGTAKGSIVVTTTLDKTQVHNEDQTFTVIYTPGDCGFIINGQTINRELMVTG